MIFLPILENMKSNTRNYKVFITNKILPFKYGEVCLDDMKLALDDPESFWKPSGFILTELMKYYGVSPESFNRVKLINWNYL